MLTVGTYIADRYEIVSKVGAGGMSDVYKAKDHKLGRFVAIKILKQEFVDDVNFVTKFRTEAQSAASLEHPNIVNIYDVGSEAGLHYIVMEYVEGITLKTYIEKKRQLTFKEAVSISIQVGRGIEAAHNKHIIHRDIKPQNIIISTEGKVKVTDFGIARAATSNTINADVVGSVHYTSPEQARNGFVDNRSDIYSLGIVMYEMVTGRVPFDGDTTVAIAIQHLQEEMVIPSAYAPNLPISLEKIILKCTQKSPDRRYQDMVELLADLRKSLINPDEDFVEMIPLNNQDKTRVITSDEVNQINREMDKARARDIDIAKLEEVDEKTEEEKLEQELEANGILNPKMERTVTILGIVAAAVIVGIIIYFCGSVLGFFDTGKSNKNNNQVEQQVSDNSEKKEDNKIKDDKEKIKMIDLKGMTVDEAKAALRQKGYTDITIKELGEQASEEFEEGQIISQDPEADEEIEADTKIKVILSGGPEIKEVTVPSGLEGMTEAEAEAALSEVGLYADKQYENNADIESGKVISVNPSGGSTLSEGGTVSLIISSGPVQVQVPNVVGQSLEGATQSLGYELYGLSVGNVTHQNDDNVPAGNVISQAISDGTWVNKGSSVDLVVSDGPASKAYGLNQSISVPGDGHNYVSANVKLVGSDGSILMDYGDIDVSGRSSFTANASNIMNLTGGTVEVTWTYEDTIVDGQDEDGNDLTHTESGSNSTSTSVTFTEQ